MIVNQERSNTIDRNLIIEGTEIAKEMHTREEATSHRKKLVGMARIRQTLITINLGTSKTSSYKPMNEVVITDCNR